MIKSLCIFVTFHFVFERLIYLTKISNRFHELSPKIQVFIVTNTESLDHHALIREAIGCEVVVVVPRNMGHPYLLTWAHFDIARRLYGSDSEITHFLYIEDDIEITRVNIDYWLNARDALHSTGFYPSFLRIEFLGSENEPRSTDAKSKFALSAIPVVSGLSDDYCYINIPYPYQGMYLLDREMAKEHFFGPSSSPDFGVWKIREKAAQGLTFSNVPRGFLSRNLLGFIRSTHSIDSNALIHHTPNSYANNPETLFGKILVKNLVL